MAHRHHYESPDNSMYIRKTLQCFWCLLLLIGLDSLLSYYKGYIKLYLEYSSHQIWQKTSSINAALFSLQTSIQDCIVVSSHPYRQGVMCEMTLSPISSSSSPTVWRCMPTQYRDSTKHCWMTSHRSERVPVWVMIRFRTSPSLKHAVVDLIMWCMVCISN